MDNIDYLSFKLPDEFITSYKKRKVVWGFQAGAGNSLGEITFFNNYSRLKADGKKEKWHETCRRVVEGYYSILKDHCAHSRTNWNEIKAMASAKDAYERMFEMKWLPPGRGLWAMGSYAVNGEHNAAPLYNCSVLSTEKISPRSVHDAVFPFVRLMEESMWGIGVGFDTRGAGNITLHEPNPDESKTFVVPDTREGWAESLGVLLETYFFGNRSVVNFDYSLIRAPGTPLKRFGGTAAGAGPLIDMHATLRTILGGREGEKLSSKDIVDIMNLAGKAVVAGGIRRSALIALGDADDKEFINLKNYDVYPERNGMDGWSNLSNNSVIARVGGEYDHLMNLIADNGEPGLVYLDVCRAYGRTGDAPDYKDEKVVNVNPCAEIALEHAEKCNLSETFPFKHETLHDYLRTIKHAYMYNKAVTLLPTPWPETNEVINRNRRIGLSISGAVQFVENRGWNEFKHWLDTSYNEVLRRDVQYSSWLGIRESIKHTAIKPSGSVSLVAGCTPGVHWPKNRTYIRRMRFRQDSPLLTILSEAGYPVEPDVMDPQYTAVVELPVRGPDVRTEEEVTLWEKMSLAALMQKHFTDNAVSCTISFQSHEKDQIAAALRAFEGQLKTASFLPIVEKGSYAQMPYEEITEEEYEARAAKIQPMNWKELYANKEALSGDAEAEKFCTTDVCELPSL